MLSERRNTFDKPNIMISTKATVIFLFRELQTSNLLTNIKRLTNLAKLTHQIQLNSSTCQLEDLLTARTYRRSALQFQSGKNLLCVGI